VYFLVRWRLHSFGFVFGLTCALAGKGKCVHCVLAKIEFEKMCGGENKKY